jgi:hypothetical protein
MVTWRIVDDNVECLHVERNPTISFIDSARDSFVHNPHHPNSKKGSQLARNVIKKQEKILSIRIHTRCQFFLHKPHILY